MQDIHRCKHDKCMASEVERIKVNRKVGGLYYRRLMSGHNVTQIDCSQASLRFHAIPIPLSVREKEDVERF